MELRGNMVVKDKRDGLLYILDSTSASAGQYDVGTYYKGLPGRLTPSGVFSLTAAKKPKTFDTVSDADKVEFVCMTDIHITWRKSDEKTAKYEEETESKVLADIRKKLTPNEIATLERKMK